MATAIDGRDVVNECMEGRRRVLRWRRKGFRRPCRMQRESASALGRAGATCIIGAWVSWVSTVVLARRKSVKLSGHVGRVTNGVEGWRVNGGFSPAEHERGWLASGC